MEIIIADANIFVYLFRLTLLNKLLLSNFYQIKITQEVFNELTGRTRRIRREHPELSNIIQEAVHNQEPQLEMIDVQNYEGMDSNDALQLYFELNDAHELDAGEIESIPLALALNGRFISNDNDAVVEANQRQFGLGVIFIDFCIEIFCNGIFSDEDLNKIKKFMENY